MSANYVWRKESSQTIPNLEVLSIDGKDVGIIYKPKSTGGDKNSYRCYWGIGDASKFIGHSWSKVGAKAIVVKGGAK